MRHGESGASLVDELDSVLDDLEGKGRSTIRRGLLSFTPRSSAARRSRVTKPAPGCKLLRAFI